MRTFMFTWNPDQGRPDDLSAFIADIAKGRPGRDDWSTGKRKDLPVGSRFFLLRQGQDPKGIVASGYTTSKPQPSGQPNQHSMYCDVVCTAVLDDRKGHVISLDELRNAPLLATIPWGIPSGGMEFTAPQAAQLEELWRGLLLRLGMAELPHAS
jgi:5-methylcytosine-specific restriction protein A